MADELVRSPAVAGAAPTKTAKNPDADGVVALGNAYLETHPREAETTFLLARLPGIDPKRRVLRQLQALTPAIAEDFQAGRVVTVTGWQLSRTEARAAAAVALGA
jgi:hypothetical protein